jgi:hypothetical protein
MRRSRTLFTLFTVSALGAAGLLAGSAQAASPSPTPTITVMAQHLNNPRGLSWSRGKLYVAEAGRGSTSHCLTDPSGNTNCAGLTGSFDRVNAHGVTRLTKRLLSVSGPGGIGAAGAVAVSADDGRVFGQMGGNTVGIPPSGFPQWLLRAAHRQLGHFGMVSNGSFTPLSAVGDADYRWTNRHKYLVPDQFPDSNPNGLWVHDGMRIVADAGANAISAVGPRGRSRVVAFFPAPKGSITDSVITCVAPGPDHALYVGELLGGTYAPGGARVWRVGWSHGHVTKSVWAKGLTTIQGCGFDRWGNFYATEFQTGGLNEDPSASPLGDVVKIAPSGQRTVLGTGQLFWPSGFAAGPDGSIYVSNCSIAPSSGLGPCPNGGQVVRIH